MKLSLLLLVSVLHPPTAAQNDVVPFEHQLYDYFLQLAAHGRIPNYAAPDFAGRRLYTKREFAQLLLPLLTSEESAPQPGLDDLDETLVKASLELQPQLEKLGFLKQQMERFSDLTGTPLLTGSGRGFAQSNSSTPDRSYGIGRAAVYGSVGSNLDYFVSGSNLWRLRQTARPEYDTVMTTSFRFKLLGFSFDVGNGWDRWGESLTGSLEKSADNPAFTRMYGEKNFSLGWLGKWRAESASGWWREAGERRYFSARRYTRSFGAKWDFSIIETMFSTQKPNFTVHLMPLLAWQKFFVDSADEDKHNILTGGEIGYQRSQNGRFYANLAVDDFPTSEHVKRERGIIQKIGYTVGYHYSAPLSPKRQNLLVEYVQNDPQLYIHRNPDVQQDYRGILLGHPWGADQKGGVIQYSLRPEPKWTVGMELEVRRQRSNNPSGPGDMDKAALQIGYDWGASWGITLTIGRTKHTTPAGVGTTDTALAIDAAFGF